MDIKEKINFINNMCDAAYDMRREINRIFVTNVIENTFNRIEELEKVIKLIKEKHVNVFSEIRLNNDYQQYLAYMNDIYPEGENYLLNREEWDFLKRTLYD